MNNTKSKNSKFNDDLNKCMVFGCENRIGEGGMIVLNDNNLICNPCLIMIRTGKITNGKTFIHDLNNKLELITEIVNQKNND